MPSNPLSNLLPTRFATLLLCGALPLAACSSDSGDNETDTGTADAFDVADTAPDATEDAAEDTTGDSGADTTDDVAPDAPSRCWDDLAPGETEVFYDGFDGGSEGIAFGNDGRLYVTADDTVWAFDADGQATEFATVPTALGLAPTDDGLIVASIGESTVAGVADGAVYHVSADGTATLIADGIDSPNFVAVMPDGSALISDDFDTRVFRVTRDGDVTEAIVDIPSPNGMGYLPDGSAIVVASTFTTEGQITSIPVDEAGVPATDGWTEIAQLGAGATADGLAVAANGDVYVAANLRSEIVRIPADGSEWEVAATGVATAASLAFGNGDGFDPCSIYVTQLFGSQVVRVSLGVEGAALVPFE